MAVNRLAVCLVVSCIVLSSAQSNDVSESPCDGARVIYQDLNQQDDGRQQNLIFNVPEKGALGKKTREQGGREKDGYEDSRRGLGLLVSKITSL